MTPPGARPLWQRWLRVMILSLIGAGMVAFLLTRASDSPWAADAGSRRQLPHLRTGAEAVLGSAAGEPIPGWSLG